MDRHGAWSRGSGGLTVALLLAVACTASGEGPTTSPATPARSPGAPSQTPTASPSFLLGDPALEPYPYTTPTPPDEPSILDGAYLRILTIEQAGDLPIPCRRCAEYRLTAGVSTLILYRGRFYVEHQLSGFRGIGHFALSGDRITFFNDPNCPELRGIYAWTFEDERLTLRLIQDGCAFGRLRGIDLTTGPWIKPDNPCSIANRWPMLPSCMVGPLYVDTEEPATP